MNPRIVLAEDLRTPPRANHFAPQIATVLRTVNGKFTLDNVMGSAALGFAVVTCIGVTTKQQKPPDDSKVLLWTLKNRKGPLLDKPIELGWQAACGKIA